MTANPTNNNLHEEKNYCNEGTTISILLHTPTYIHNWSLLPRLLLLFMAILFILRVFSRNQLRGSHRRNIFSYFVLLEMSDLGFERWPYTIFRQAFLLIQYSFISKQYFFCSDREYQYFFDKW